MGIPRFFGHSPRHRGIQMTEASLKREAAPARRLIGRPIAAEPMVQRIEPLGDRDLGRVGPDPALRHQRAIARQRPGDRDAVAVFQIYGQFGRLPPFVSLARRSPRSPLIGSGPASRQPRAARMAAGCLELSASRPTSRHAVATPEYAAPTI